jgi:hypothetical protein
MHEKQGYRLVRYDLQAWMHLLLREPTSVKGVLSISIPRGGFPIDAITPWITPPS